MIFDGFIDGFVRGFPKIFPGILRAGAASRDFSGDSWGFSGASVPPDFPWIVKANEGNSIPWLLAGGLEIYDRTLPKQTSAWYLP